jgi:hypothetical protein
MEYIDIMVRVMECIDIMVREWAPKRNGIGHTHLSASSGAKA